MAKKYLTLEEAAAKLSMSTEDLRKLREQGEIRGFADRSSWKFRDEDIENYARAMNPNSAASIPAYDDDDQLPITAEEEPLLDDSASDVRLILDEDLLAPELGEQEDSKVGTTEPAMDSAIRLGESDSDITAATDDTMKTKQAGVSPESAISLGDSDSEVTAATDDTLKMTSQQQTQEQGEDTSISGIGEAIADSGITLAPDSDEKSESDSDVKLVPDSEADTSPDVEDGDGSSVRIEDWEEDTEEGSSITAGSSIKGVDDDITLDAIDSDVSDAPSVGDSDVKLVDNDSNVLMEAQSDDDDGVTLAAGSSIISGEEDSGISLEAADSGISLEAADSGISLESLDSGINLTDETTEVDFGLEPDDSGLSLESGDEAEKTVAMDSLGGEDDPEDFNDTAFEIDAEGSSEYEISGGLDEGDEEDDTSVLLLDDDDESDAASATLIGGQADDFADEDAFDLGDDMVDDFGDSDLLVEETVVGDDDELDDLDVFDAVDEDFEDDFGEMGSAGEFAAPVGMRMAAPAEPEMGTGIFVGVLISSIMMAVCCLIMVDLARTMWSYEQPASYTSPLLDMIKGFF